MPTVEVWEPSTRAVILFHFHIQNAFSIQLIITRNAWIAIASSPPQFV
jgi:hypothetical protein